MWYDSYTMPTKKWEDIRQEAGDPLLRPPIHISTNEARQQFATVILLAASGHEVTITRYGKPLVTMTSAMSHEATHPMLRPVSEPLEVRNENS
jgi:prevent-host-death family protein